MISFLLAMYVRVGFLGHNGNSTFNILNNYQTFFFFKAAAPFYIPISSIKVLISSHPCQRLLSF